MTELTCQVGKLVKLLPLTGHETVPSPVGVSSTASVTRKETPYCNEKGN